MTSKSYAELKLNINNLLSKYVAAAMSTVQSHDTTQKNCLVEHFHMSTVNN